MKKRFFIPACILTAVAIIFIIYILKHPEMQFPWDIKYNGIFYGLYAVITVLLYALAFTKPYEWRAMYLTILIMELVAIFFIVMSMTRMSAEDGSNWYLPLGLALNAVAMCINTRYQKKKRKKIN